MHAHRRSEQICRLARLMVLLALAAGGFSGPADAMRREPMKLHTARGEQVVSVEITETPEEKTRGLMFRTRLPDNEGMLFAYDPPREITMWMRNTYIPLDMLFIRADGTIDSIGERTTPLSEKSVPSKGPVRFVLEINGGLSDRLGIEAGDRVTGPAMEARP